MAQKIGSRTKSETDKTAAYWEENFARHRQDGPAVVHWWDHPLATKLYRDLYRKDDSDESLRASHLLLGDISKGRTYKSAISFACGIGWKEIDLVRRGLVDRFTLVELAPSLCDAARNLATEHGVSDKIEVVTSSFEDFNSGSVPYDLVYWDAALHHMSDTRFAVSESMNMLSEGGVFFADDYVGPSYNQYGDEMYDLGDKLRSFLPSDWFEGEGAIPRTLGRYGVDEVLASDPTEAADSYSILPSVAGLMPGVSIYPMGGVTYMVACREAFGKFAVNDPSCDSLMRLMFELERQFRITKPEYTLQAMISWVKGSAGVVQDDWRNCIPKSFLD